MIRRRSVLAVLVPVTLLALCGCANRPATLTLHPAAGVEATSSISTGAVDGITITMRTPRTLQAAVRDEYSLTLTNSSDQLEAIRPHDWLMFSSARGHMCASVHSARAWLKSKNETVSLPPGGSLEITYSVLLREPGEYSVGANVPAGYVAQDTPTATVTVE